MKCPIDGSELVMSERQGIEIDYCPSCRGVWLDRGELDKIIDRSGSEATSYREPPREHHAAPQHDRSYQQPYRKKKKSFLGDIFDFD
ncbi:TFIIB-type zinc ribbon-containing protein [Pseudaminobacter sp. NGMCC 1.201702]|uniref:TFIIB-type zinc ribbon-containing protein n=1 Tax=Pseudaminobacter sp. NGMCC 1.201702 TaxID=3391825 RepID=UPI0039EE40A7